MVVAPAGACRKEDADPASMTNDSSRFLSVPAPSRKLLLVCCSGTVPRVFDTYVGVLVHMFHVCYYMPANTQRTKKELLGPGTPAFC